MGVDSNLNAEESLSLMKIVNERIRIPESSLACTCDSQPFACEACDFTVNTAGDGLGGKEAVIRQRFRTDKESLDSLRTSGFDEAGGGWIERDPETTQTFKRKQQVFNSVLLITILKTNY